jgi:hypothetical protein
MGVFDPKPKIESQAVKNFARNIAGQAKIIAQLHYHYNQWYFTWEAKNDEDSKI